MANETLEQEISTLEQALQEKKALREQQEVAAQPESSDRQLLHEVVGQHIQQQSAVQPAPAPQAPAVPAAPDAGAGEVSNVVQALVNTAMTKSIKEAIGQAVQTNNAALIDAFHDTLVDELYDELVTRGKIERPA